jgi:hypothetical protein
MESEPHLSPHMDRDPEQEQEAEHDLEPEFDVMSRLKWGADRDTRTPHHHRRELILPSLAKTQMLEQDETAMRMDFDMRLDNDRNRSQQRPHQLEEDDDSAYHRKNLALSSHARPHEHNLDEPITRMNSLLELVPSSRVKVSEPLYPKSTQIAMAGTAAASNLLHVLFVLELLLGPHQTPRPRLWKHCCGEGEVRAGAGRIAVFVQHFAMHANDQVNNEVRICAVRFPERPV